MNSNFCVLSMILFFLYDEVFSFSSSSLPLIIHSFCFHNSLLLLIYCCVLAVSFIIITSSDLLVSCLHFLLQCWFHSLVVLKKDHQNERVSISDLDNRKRTFCQRHCALCVSLLFIGS